MDDIEEQNTAIEVPKSPENELEANARGLTLKQVLNNPHKRRMVELAKELIAEGISIRKTSKATKLSPHVCSLVAERFEEEIGPMKKNAAKQMRYIRSLSSDALIEQLEDPKKREAISPQQHAVLIGIMTDKEQQLEGEPTQRVEHTHSAEDFRDIKELYNELPKGKPIIDVTPTDKE